MLVALQDGQRIEAWSADRACSFACPQCRGQVILKRGRVVVAHFAHKPPTDCSWASGETRAHLDAKHHVWEILTQRGLKADIEFVIPALPGDRRADVMVWSPTDKQLAIELQHSSIGLDEVEARAATYARLGIAQIWIPFLSAKTLDEGEHQGDGSLLVREFAPRQFEKWAHGFGGSEGMWMYHPQDRSFWHARLAKHMIYVPITEWYGEGGEEMNAGGYERYSKKYRELTLVGPHNLGNLRIKVRNRRPNSLAHYNWPGGRIATLVTS